MTEPAKCVVVTGGTRGLGLAIVSDLLAAGYSIATCGRRASQELHALGERYGAARLYWNVCEIGNEAAEKEYFRGLWEWTPPATLYGLVNNAGIAGEGILATFPTVESQRIMEVNLMGPLRLSRLALQVMLARPGPGRIINISSIIGSRGYTGLAAYSASKAGLDGLTRSLAREVGRRQITVNSVAPGYLETDMSASLGSDQRQQIVRRTPMGRLATTADIVPAVRFLLADDARFITGQTWIIDGGITC